MGVRAAELSVLNYRSFSTYTLGLDPGVTVLAGHNAAGKTNLVEALQLLTAGASFRRPAAAELLREGAQTGKAQLTLKGDGRLLTMGLEVTPEKRVFTRNGKKTRAAGVRGVLPSVLFCPDNLDMIKRSARMRRDALDSFGVQLNAQYGKLLSAYERTVEQRNNLLKDVNPSRDVLAAWDESLIAAGSSLLMHRVALLARIRAHFVRVYSEIAPHERADVSYEASIGPLSQTREEVASQFACALEHSRGDELRRGITLVGPHRDEICFTIDGRAARDYGSQGQQRSLVLAWKIAEVEVTQDILGQYPLLLLDDVMSELDERRREAIMGFVEDGIQTVITTTNLGYFSDEVLEKAKVVRVGHEE